MEQQNNKVHNKELDDEEDIAGKSFQDLLPFSSDNHTTESFLKEIFNLMIRYIFKVFDRREKVIDFQPPSLLLEGIDGFSVKLDGKSVKLGDLIHDCENTLKYGMKTGHPRHFNTLSSGLDLVSLAGEWLTATANANIINYEFAPVFVSMEKTVLERMRSKIGWKSGDGIFAPGGSISNLYAMMLARQFCVENVKTKGLVQCGQILCSYQSRHAHYSVSKMAQVLGIGLDNAINVDVDESGCLDVDDLEKQILLSKEENKVPFMVTATSGTSVVGAFDPISKIHKICKKYGLWLHVDASWGGGALMSTKHRHLLEGIELADSVTWNPHKMMNILLQCSVILTKHEGMLYSCNQMSAPYLFQTDKNYDTAHDVGDKTIQCGRHVDVFKLWLSWKARGDCGIAEQMEKCMDLAQYFYKKLQETEGFELVYKKPPQYTNICFWYVPTWIRNIEDANHRTELLSTVAPSIKAEMVREGNTIISYNPLDDHVNFFRMVITNPAAQIQDLDFMLKTIERLGENLQHTSTQLSNGNISNKI